MTDTTALTIGPLRVIVAAHDSAVHTALRSAYRAFAEEDLAVPHSLTAHVTYTSGPAPADWPFTFDEGVLRFTAPHCHGAIDLGHHTAQVAITAPHPFEPIDYFVRTALALLAFEAGGLLFHAAGLARHDRGYGFFGYSGSGKTTVARVSRDATILNDDLVVLLPQASYPAARQASRSSPSVPPLAKRPAPRQASRPYGETGTGKRERGNGSADTGARTREADQWWISATPFSNPTQVMSAGPQSVPLAALYRLVQDRSVFAEPIEPATAVAEIVASSPVVSADPDRALDLLARAAQLVSSVPVHRLHFLPDASFWNVIE